jgi:iron complex transport system substrate-binding protein
MGSNEGLRIVSLLPGLTELVCKLGLKENLAGRSHECDYPEDIARVPVLTAPKYPSSVNKNSRDIHQSVTELLRQGLSVYRVFAEKLAELQPDIILTQDHCEVCAVSFNDLKTATETFLDKETEIISVSPVNLNEIFDSFLSISNALGKPKKGLLLIEKLQSRFQEIQRKLINCEKPSVVSIEWMDPLMTGGNWMPELIEIAGGRNQLSEKGKHSPWIRMENLLDADPDILLILPCGYTIPETLSEIELLTQKKNWPRLKSVKENQVYILDGNSYFNRSGPRLLESVEILTQVLHPDLFEPTLHQKGWIHFDHN